MTSEVDIINERIARIPDRYRYFSESAERAKRFYRIPADVLDRLLDLGLPHSADGLLFDANDLKSISMALPGRSPQRGALKSMADALDAGATSDHIGRTVSLQAHCPYPGHEGLCHFQLAAEVGSSDQTVHTRALDGLRFDIDVAVPGGGPRYLTFTGPERQLVEEVSRIRFHRIPFVLNLDLGFLAETGLADCRLASRFLGHRGHELGIPVREATGLYLSRPFSPRHYWIELSRDGEWVTADPFFLVSLARWGLLDPQAWPVNRSPRGAFWKVEIHPDAPLVTHLGAAGLSILTS